MIGADALVALPRGIRPGTTVLGMGAETAKMATIALVDVLMIIYVMVGGMKGTAYVQIVKAFLLMGGALIMTLLVLAHYRFNLSSLLGDAAAGAGRWCGDHRAGPGREHRGAATRPGARHRLPRRQRPDDPATIGPGWQPATRVRSCH